MIEFTTALASVPHGGNLAEAERLFPGAQTPFIDLSTGINPNAYPIAGLGPEQFRRLPEPDLLARLERQAALHYGVPAGAGAMATAGTQPILTVLPRLFEGKEVAIVGPTYGEHARAWLAAGHRVREISDIGASEGAAIVVLVRPNNPDGRILPASEILKLQAGLGKSGGLVVLDEAFVDLLPDRVSLAGHSGEPGLLVLRSFGKAYGLAGVRLSFALAQVSMIERLRTFIGPWPVSGPALQLGFNALSDSSWLASAKRISAGQAQRLRAALLASGATIIGGTPLFQLIELDSAERLFGHLGRRGIHVRRFDYNKSWLRIGLPPDEAACWQRVEDGFSSYAMLGD